MRDKEAKAWRLDKAKRDAALLEWIEERRAKKAAKGE